MKLLKLSLVKCTQNWCEDEIRRNDEMRRNAEIRRNGEIKQKRIIISQALSLSHVTFRLLTVTFNLQNDSLVCQFFLYLAKLI